MRFLIDTHTLLWYLENDKRLSGKAKSIIETASNEIAVNIASFWEITIKNSVGKLELSRQLPQMMEEVRKQQFRITPIEESFLVRINTMPFHHRDPFDRMLIAQCLTENIPILSKDPALDAYGVTRIWD